MLGMVTVAIAGGAFAISRSDGAGAPAAPPRRVFAFLSHAGGAELARLGQVGRRISVLAPNWYTLELDDGAISPPSGTGPVITAARRVGVPLWPVVNARTAGSAAIGDPVARERAAQAIARVAAQRGYAGVTLDIEELLPAQRDDFSALVARVGQLVHADRRRLAVYVPRPTDVGSSLAYDLEALASAADLVVVSTYNEHARGSSPGPLDSIDGFGHVLRRAAAVSRRRVAPILGAIGYSWPATGGGGALLSSVDGSRRRAHCRSGGRIADGTASFACHGQVVYYATGAGLRARARTVGAAGFRWMALFSLGREPRSFWDGMPNIRAKATQP